MSHEVLNIPPDLPKTKVKTKFVDKISTIYKTHLPVFIDSLVLLNITFWYFFFTGLAILFRSPIPKEWMRIATHLTKGKVAKKIRDMSVASEMKENRFKVVDLESKKTLYDGVMPPTA